MQSNSERKISLNRNQLKYIAIIAMIIDHVAWKWFSLSEPVGYVLHIFGRFTAPCMCFFIAEGFKYTRNKKKYGQRLLVFALVSWIPFYFFEYGKLPFSTDLSEMFKMLSNQSMIFTLFLGFLSLCVLHGDFDKFTKNSILSIILKVVIVLVLCLLDMKSDWHVSGILMVIVFYEFGDNKLKQVLAFSGTALGVVLYKLLKAGAYWKMNLFQVGLLTFTPLLCLYNGKKGSSSSFHKWFFYIFYPSHLIVLGLIKRFLLK